MARWAKSTEFLAIALICIPTLLGVLSDEFHIFALGSALMILVLLAAMVLPQWMSRWQQTDKEARS